VILAEANWLHICNNNVILTNYNQELQMEELMRRGFSPKQGKERIKSMLTTEEKKTEIEKSIEKHNYGKIWHIKKPAQINVPELLNNILNDIK